MKEAFYFSHDYHARSDTKIVKLLQYEKLEWYAIFWMLVEMLYENDWYIEKDYERIAFDMRTECERIANVVEKYWLFNIDNNMIFSNSVLRRLCERKERSKKAKESAEHRWNKPKNANALRTQSDRNAIKERKGKEIKGKEIDTNTVLSHQKNENEDFFERVQTDTDWIIQELNLQDHYNEAKLELFKFWNYWTEKTMKWKERWKTEKTFEVKRRLTIWLLNKKFTFNQSPYGKKWNRIAG